MHAPTSIRRLLPAASLAFVALAACSESTASSGAPVALSFAARGDVASGGSASTAGSGGTIIVSGSDTLRLTSARLVIDQLELARTTSDVCTGSSSGQTSSSGCFEAESGPYLVSLPLHGGMSSALTMRLPAGTFSKLHLKLRHADVGDDPAFDAAHPEMRGISVLVQGTYHGQPFTWRGDVDSELEMYFSPPMVVDGAGNVTVNIDVGGWFRSGTGAIIDPATAGAGQENYGIVAQNIRASFDVYEDDDRDGRDDHGGDRTN